MASDLQKKAARYREAAVELKLKAEQEPSFSRREQYFERHHRLLRLAIVCEEEEIESA
jgi:hypothetical protein